MTTPSPSDKQSDAPAAPSKSETWPGDTQEHNGKATDAICPPGDEQFNAPTTSLQPDTWPGDTQEDTARAADQQVECEKHEITGLVESDYVPHLQKWLDDNKLQHDSRSASLFDTPIAHAHLDEEVPVTLQEETRLTTDAACDLKDPVDTSIIPESQEDDSDHDSQVTAVHDQYHDEGLEYDKDTRDEDQSQDLNDDYNTDPNQHDSMPGEAKDSWDNSVPGAAGDSWDNSVPDAAGDNWENSVPDRSAEDWGAQDQTQANNAHQTDSWDSAPNAGQWDTENQQTHEHTKTEADGYNAAGDVLKGFGKVFEVTHPATEVEVGQLVDVPEAPTEESTNRLKRELLHAGVPYLEIPSESVISKMKPSDKLAALLELTLDMVDCMAKFVDKQFIFHMFQLEADYKETSPSWTDTEDGLQYADEQIIERKISLIVAACTGHVHKFTEDFIRLHSNTALSALPPVKPIKSGALQLYALARIYHKSRQFDGIDRFLWSPVGLVPSNAPEPVLTQDTCLTVIIDFATFLCTWVNTNRYCEVSVKTEYGDEKLQKFGANIGDFIESGVTKHFSNLWTKFLASLSDLADPWKTTIKVHLEKWFNVRDIFTAYAYTAEYTHDAVREAPKHAPYVENIFDFDVDPSLVAAKYKTEDLLVKPQDVLDALSAEERMEHQRNLQGNVLFSADALFSIQKARQLEQQNYKSIDLSIEQANDPYARRMQIMWGLRTSDPAFFAKFSEDDKNELQSFIDDFKSRGSRRLKGHKDVSEMPYEAASEIGERNAAIGLTEPDSMPLALQTTMQESVSKPVAQAKKDSSLPEARPAVVHVLKGKASVWQKKTHEMIRKAASAPSMAKRALFMLDGLQQINQSDFQKVVGVPGTATILIPQEGTPNESFARALAKSVRHQLSKHSRDMITVSMEPADFEEYLATDLIAISSQHEYASELNHLNAKRTAKDSKATILHKFWMFPKQIAIVMELFNSSMAAKCPIRVAICVEAPPDEEKLPQDSDDDVATAKGLMNNQAVQYVYAHNAYTGGGAVKTVWVICRNFFEFHAIGNTEADEAAPVKEYDAVLHEFY